MDDLIKSLINIAGAMKEIDESEIRQFSKDNLDEEQYRNVVNLLKEKGITVISNKDYMHFDEPDEGALSSLEIETFDIANLIKDEPYENIQVSNDPVRMYLKEIGQIPLLKSDEEKKYGQAVYEANQVKEYLEKEREKGTELDKKTLRQCEKKIQKGEVATTKLIEANYRLVVAIAKKYEKSGMSFLDLIQDGNMGLMKAVEKFDYTKGFKFSTYATWWIKQAITRSIAEKSRTIRIPVHMNETINKMNKIRRELVQELCREPSDEEISDRLGETVEKIQYIKSIARDPMSLETPVGEEDDSSLGDFISDPNSITPHDYMERENKMEVLSEILETLTDREEKVLRMRSGLYDGHEYTLEEVGQEFHVTRERIRQIENKAKAKLRNSVYKNKLKKFYNK